MTLRATQYRWFWLVLAGLLLQGCWRRSLPEQALISNANAEAPLPPGQSGPSPELAAELGQAPLALSARRTEQQRQDGERLWKLELHQGDRLLASWEAVSGSASSQSLDRKWSPGNGAPLPAGTYSLGLPEAWGSDVWFSLTPRFKTTRTGLGIHGCNPGSGCVCLPERASLEALAKWVSTSQIQTLRVLN